MKKNLFLIVSTIVGLGLFPAYSQSTSPGGPHLGGPMSKLFGSNQTFSAGMEMHVADQSGQPVTIPGKLSFDTGKQCFAFNLTDIKGGQMPPNAAAQMKTMGLDEMVTVARPDKKVFYMIYPGLQSYIEMPLPKADSAPTNGDFKVETTEIGKETLDGHPCLKNKYVVTSSEGVKHESTVWNATDLKNFPVKIQTSEDGSAITMLFNNVSLTKPAASVFEPPAGYKKYDSAQALMQQEVMKRMGSGMGGMGGPPGAAGTPPAK